VADDHRILRQGLCRLLDGRHGLTVVGEAEDGRRAVALVRREQPDVLVLDLQMPVSTGLDVLRELAELGDNVKVLILTGSTDRAQMAAAIELGARGIVDKTEAIDCLVDAIHAVAAGDYWIGRRSTDDVEELRRAFSSSTNPARERLNLTERQWEIVASVVGGLTNPQIAARLSISPETVKHHLTQIFHKTGVSTRLELALLAREHGIGSS
jgi:DNA-binding NarL/FixJ family response regulator